MSDLVLLHHNEPMTTSLAIAAGTDNEHGSVMLLIRKYIDEIQQFGKVSFEVAPEGNSRFEISGTVVEVKNPRDKAGRPTEIAFLNEGQSTLLVTLMRNSEIVVRFKVSLVKAFYEMRDRLTAPRQPAFSAVDHRADVLVSADRTFRAVLRSARAAGARFSEALARANEVTVQETGVDMLAQIGPIERPVSVRADPVESGVAEWVKQAGDGPYSMAEILRQAFGLESDARDYGRITVMAANALRAAGFVSRKRRLGGPPRSYWERAA